MSLILSAGAAAAECPVAADMAGGIRVTYADGSQEIVRREAGSVLVTTESRSRAGGGIATATVHGLFPRSREPFDPYITDASDFFAYDVPAESLPTPGPGLRITLDRESSGIYATRSRDVYETGPLTATSVGGCPYQVFGVAQATATTAIYSGADGRVSRLAAGHVYLTELGFAVPLWGGSDGAERLEAPAVVALEPL